MLTNIKNIVLFLSISILFTSCGVKKEIETTQVEDKWEIQSVQGIADSKIETTTSEVSSGLNFK